MNAERSTAAVILGLAELMGLGAFEIGQTLGIGPAGIPGGGPVVEISGAAAQIGHRVDRPGAAEDLAAWPDHALAAKGDLGLGAVSPIEHAFFAKGEEPGRHGDEGIGIRWTGFEEKDVAGGIGREAVGENASGRAATNDDVIITKVVGRDDGPLLFC